MTDAPSAQFCGRCAAFLSYESWCRSCGGPGGADAALAESWSASVRRDPALRVLGSLIDVVAVIGAATVGWLIGARYSPTSGAITAALLALPVLAFSVWCVGRYGRALGGLIVGLRTLDRRTGYPPRGALGLLGLAGVTVGRTRGAVDPLGPTRLIDSEAVPVAAAPALRMAPTPRLTQRLAYVEVNGSGTPIGARLLIGRYPVARTPGDEGNWLEIPDLTRTMSRAHCVLESDPAGNVWITDVGSSNGSYICQGDDLVELRPFERTPLGAAGEISLGKQRLAIVRRSRSAL